MRTLKTISKLREHPSFLTKLITFGKNVKKSNVCLKKILKKAKFERIKMDDSISLTSI